MLLKYSACVSSVYCIVQIRLYCFFLLFKFLVGKRDLVLRSPPWVLAVDAAVCACDLGAETRSGQGEEVPMSKNRNWVLESELLLHQLCVRVSG